MKKARSEEPLISKGIGGVAFKMVDSEAGPKYRYVLGVNMAGIEKFNHGNPVVPTHIYTSIPERLEDLFALEKTDNSSVAEICGLNECEVAYSFRIDKDYPENCSTICTHCKTERLIVFIEGPGAEEASILFHIIYGGLPICRTQKAVFVRGACDLSPDADRCSCEQERDDHSHDGLSDLHEYLLGCSGRCGPLSVAALTAFSMDRSRNRCFERRLTLQLAVGTAAVTAFDIPAR